MVMGIRRKIATLDRGGGKACDNQGYDHDQKVPLMMSGGRL